MSAALVLSLAGLVACGTSPSAVDATTGVDAAEGADAASTPDSAAALDAAPPPTVAACPEQPEPAFVHVFDEGQDGRRLSHVRAAAGVTGVGVLWKEGLADESTRLLFGVASGTDGISAPEEVWRGEPTERIHYSFVHAIGDTYVAIFDVWNGEYGELDFQGRVMAVAITVEEDTLAVGVPQGVLASGVAPYAVSLGDRVGVIAAEVSEVESPKLVFVAVDHRAEAPTPPVVLLADLFDPTVYDWFGLVPGNQDHQVIIRREDDQALFALLLDADGHPTDGLRDLGVSASWLSQHQLGSLAGEAIGLVEGRSSVLHLWDWDGTHRFSGAVIEEERVYQNLVRWRGRLGLLSELLSDTDPDAIDLRWNWLAPLSGLDGHRQPIGNVTVFRDGAVYSGYSDGPAVVHGDRLHVFVPSSVDEDGLDGADEEYRIDHLTACIE
jgi:hypothetical protein